MRKAFISIFLTVLLAGCATTAGGPVLQNDGVRFTFHAPAAKSIALSGSFNHWNDKGLMLAGPDRGGMWRITVPLAPGRYEYAYIVDGTLWQLDPGAPSQDDGLGSRNSVIEVP